MLSVYSDLNSRNLVSKYATASNIVIVRDDGKIENKLVPSFTKHHATCYISLARLVADLAEQWLEEEEARVTDFTVAGFRPAGHEVDINAGKETFVKRNRRSAGCYSRQESKNRFD